MANFNTFSPTAGVLRGQQIEQGLSQAELEGIALRDQKAARRAAAKMGEGEYFTGYEGVPGAIRPGYLKELYAEGDPSVAMAMEERLNEPYRVSRGIETAGRTEEAKKTADMKVMTNAMRDFFPGSTTGGMANAMAPAMAPAPAAIDPMASEVEAPSSPNVGEPGAVPAGGTMPAPNFRNLSGAKRTAKFSMHGPEFAVEEISPFERAKVESEDVDRREKTNISRQTERRQAEQALHENVRKIEDEIQQTHKAQQNRDIPWGEANARLVELKREKADAVRARDMFIMGKKPPASAAAPASVMPASAPASPTAGGPGSMSDALAPAPAGPAPRFTPKEQAAMDTHDRTEKITAANKEIVNARLGTEKVMKYKRQVQDLFDLVTKQDIGHPTLEGIPGAGNVLSLNRANAQVKKLNEAIINMFAEPGQSQMMNTIVERQMQGAVVPSIFTDPQLNKINAAVLRSNVEHLQNFPTFLEKWQKTHANTLDGAADAWIDYTDHNPLYTYSRNARGQVKVMENPHVLPIDKWQKLRVTGGVRSVGDKTFMRMDDGSWVEK